jgi:hypothetical protein
MEFLDDDTLKDMVGGQCMESDRLLDIAIEIADGLVSVREGSPSDLCRLACVRGAIKIAAHTACSQTSHRLWQMWATKFVTTNCTTRS